MTFLVIGADIMAKLGNKTTTVIPAKYVAAMKATENIPWNLVDDIRRWLKTFNVQLSTKKFGMIRKDRLEKVYMLVTLTKLLILLFFHSSKLRILAKI